MSGAPGKPRDKTSELPIETVIDLLSEIHNGTADSPPVPASRRSPTSGTSPTKRRRTKTEMAAMRAALIAIIDEAAPMTVRQVYYQAVTRGLIDKTEQEYKAICRLLVLMRRDGSLPYDNIADNTRWMRKPKTYGSIEDCLVQTTRLYRRQIWADLNCRVEIWLEKEALAGVLLDVTAEWDVPLMVTRGYPSLSFLHGAGEAIAYGGIETFIYYFGDRDPSGVDIARHVAEGLTEFSDDVPVYFTPVAVTGAQIDELDLPTRPTKKSDSRAKNWVGGSVEVDAIHPSKLRALAEECIERHIPDGHMDVLQEAESSERQALRMFGHRFIEENDV